MNSSNSDSAFWVFAANVRAYANAHGLCFCGKVRGHAGWLECVIDASSVQGSGSVDSEPTTKSGPRRANDRPHGIRS